MPKVTFAFEDGQKITVDARFEENLLAIAKRTGVAIDAPCNGNGSCGKCRVKVIAGEVNSSMSRHFTDEEYAEGWRLACQSSVIEDVTVEVPEAASAFKTDIRTADLSDPKIREAFDDVIAGLKEAGVSGDPAVFSVAVTMEEPTLDDTMPDNERIEMAVEAATGKKAFLSLYAMRKLARVIRDCNFNVRCVLAGHGESVNILDILPGDDTKPICGLAIDIGTTTVSAAMADMETGTLLARASAGNGQIRYGADVINRIIESGREGGSERLRKAVVEETILPLIDEMVHQSGVPLDRIYHVCCAGNTTMSHLLLGLYSDPVRMEPFIPSFFDIEEMRAADVFPGLNPSATLILAPNTGSYVGGDITAGVLAGELWNSEEMTLFIDLGTNGEIVLGNSDYMFTCACSAGPAFEGGEISCGMRATNGAIQGITIDKETMNPTMDIIGKEGQKPAGLCGSGIIDIVAELFRTGIIDSRGKMARTGERIRHDEYGMGSYVIAFANESASGRDVSINEVDIDNFIRAKGAVFSATLLMLRQIGMEPDALDHLLIAGGIGSGIDFRNAVTIGMFPDIDESKYRYIGNSSLAGAYAMLLSRNAENKTEELANNMTYVELSNEPGYMDEFVAACFLPHTDRSLFPSVEEN